MEEVLAKLVDKTITKAQTIGTGVVEIFFTDGSSVQMIAQAGGEYDWVDMDVTLYNEND